MSFANEKRIPFGFAAVPYSMKHLNDTVNPATSLEAIERNCAAGLGSAIGVDTTGVVHLSPEQTWEIVSQGATICRTNRRPFVVGVRINKPRLDIQETVRQVGLVHDLGGLPMIMMDEGTAFAIDNEPESLVQFFLSLSGQVSGDFIVHILDNRFSPHGRWIPMEQLERIFSLKKCVGVKDSSFDTEYGDQCLRKLKAHGLPYKLTGNDDDFPALIRKGWDWLLGAGALHAGKFAEMNRLAAAEDWTAYEALTNNLGALSRWVFRDPTPAYVHRVLYFLWLQGLVKDPIVHPQAAQCEPSVEIPKLREFAEALGIQMVN